MIENVIDLEGDEYFLDEAINGILTEDNFDAIILDMANDERYYDDEDDEDFI